MTDLRQIEAALSFIPAHDRDVWWKIGMAVKSELGEEGFPLWSDWSATADTYKPTDARAVWKSFKPSGPVTIASLFGLAKEHGYRPEHPARPIDPAEMLRRARERQEAERIEREKVEAGHQEAAAKSVFLWGLAGQLQADHPYIKRKRITPVPSLREIGTDTATLHLGWHPKGRDGLLSGRLIVAPVKIGDAIASLELIDESGRKTALLDSKRSGGWWAAQPLPEGDGTGLVLIIGEGIATVLSVRMATGYPVVAALSSGNLVKVGQSMRQRYPVAKIIFVADIGNGQDKAFEAARQTGGMAVIPQLAGIDMSHERLTDFNDLHRAVGLDAVRHQIGNALENFTTEPAGPANDAPEPEEGDEIEAHRNAPRGTTAMLYGIFGEIGRTAAEGTEANPYAACMNAMVFFSACVGREVYLSIGDEFHHARLFALHIGRSSVGRKGTALALLWRIIDAIDKQERNSKGGKIAGDSRLLPKWHIGGLSSREGVVMALHNGFTLGKDEYPPIHDKRYWAVESEFANTLAQSARNGNTLSSALRDLWDGKTLKPLTKQPIGASDPHLCMSAACTPSEFLDMLTARDRDNGFINRFLIFHAERTRLESRPRPTSDDAVAKFARRLLEIIAFAKGGYCWDSDPDLSSQNRRRIKMSSEADTLYDRLYYTELNSQKDGERIAGLMHRGGPYLLRMAMLFALSDLSEVIEVHHLEAAMAWVRYWRESVKFIFNDAQEEVEQVKTSDKAERLYQWLKARGKPATRTEITNECFSKRGGSDVDKAIDALLRDTPPRIEVIEGEKAANGKRTKFYTACGLGGTGGVDCSATASPTPHGCGLGGAGFKSDTVNNQSRNPSPPTPQACGLAESIAAQSIPPSPPTPQGLNENDDAEVEL